MAASTPRKKVRRGCLRIGCKKGFTATVGQERWFCSAYCRKMARAQRPRRENEPREWSFDRDQKAQWQKNENLLRARLAARVTVITAPGTTPSKKKVDTEPEGRS